MKKIVVIEARKNMMDKSGNFFITGNLLSARFVYCGAASRETTKGIYFLNAVLNNVRITISAATMETTQMMFSEIMARIFPA